MPNLAANELTRLIYNGELAHDLNVEQLIALVNQHAPFNNDQELKDCLERGELVLLRGYLMKLQATLNYETFATYSSSYELDEYQNVGAQIPLNEYSKVYQSGTNLRRHFETLANQFSRLQIIRGDGDCYFRAIMRSFIEQAISATNPQRSQLLNHLARLIRAELLNNPNSCFRQDFNDTNAPQIARMEALANKLEQAAAGTTWTHIQQFRRDQINASDQGDDWMLIMAAKYLVADCVIANQHTEFNGMLLVHALPGGLDDGFDIHHYRRANITAMKECAEGAWVNLHFLPQLLGAVGNLFMIEPRAAVLGDPLRGDITPAFRARYQLADVPQTNIGLALVPGHYNALISAEHYQKQRENLLAAPYPEIPNFDPYLATICALNRSLRQLSTQTDNLRTSIYQLAAEVALQLLTDLRDAKARYFNPARAAEFNPQRFQRLCRAAITRATPELSKHRGIAQLLLDILNILLFPIGLIQYACTRKFRLFTIEPPEMRLMRALDEEITRIPVLEATA